VALVEPPTMPGGPESLPGVPAIQLRHPKDGAREPSIPARTVESSSS